MGANKAILVGNLGRDPELKYSQQGVAFCHLSVATRERRKKDGNWIDHTEWHRVVVFGKLAENCAAYLKKGRQVYVEGRLETDKWQDKDGRERVETKILGDSIIFLGNRPPSDDSRDDGKEESEGASGAHTGLKGGDDVRENF
jgi:single-strand DNA-binding protein